MIKPQTHHLYVTRRVKEDMRTYADLVVPDQHAHLRSLFLELHSPPIGQRYPILQKSGQCSS